MRGGLSGVGVVLVRARTTMTTTYARESTEQHRAIRESTRLWNGPDGSLRWWGCGGGDHHGHLPGVSCSPCKYFMDCGWLVVWLFKEELHSKTVERKKRLDPSGLRRRRRRQLPWLPSQILRVIKIRNLGTLMGKKFWGKKPVMVSAAEI